MNCVCEGEAEVGREDNVDEDVDGEVAEDAELKAAAEAEVKVDIVR